MKNLNTKKVYAHIAQSNMQLLPGVKNIISVASGKGGVGKSTVSKNIAYLLSDMGLNIGLLDADIYGPSQPTFLKSKGVLATHTNKKLHPILINNIQTMSISYLIKDDNTPAIWRGPMASGALLQMCKDTLWDDLDILIIDLPPGTGDIQLTLAQKLPVTGSIIVTTPEDVAVIDASKALKMFEKLKIKVLGVVENMSEHKCKNCGFKSYLFGESGGKNLAKSSKVKFLGDLPLTLDINDLSSKYKLIVNNLLDEIDKIPRANKLIASL